MAVANQWRLEVLEGLSSNLFVVRTRTDARTAQDGVLLDTCGTWCSNAPKRGRSQIRDLLCYTMLPQDCGKKPLLRRLP
jgi:hypothetical protein